MAPPVLPKWCLKRPYDQASIQAVAPLMHRKGKDRLLDFTSLIRLPTATENLLWWGTDAEGSRKPGKRTHLES